MEMWFGGKGDSNDVLPFKLTEENYVRKIS
jgi:hypothetical protein